MADREEWVIKYIDSTLAAQYGCKPFHIGSRLARDYIDKGLAILVSAPPGANLSLPKDMDTKSRLVKMPEEENLTKIHWICSTGYVDATLKKVGKSCGFEVNPMSGTTFVSRELLKANLIVVESNLRGFDTNQLLDLRAIQFHKRRPFVFRVLHLDSSEYFQQNLLHAKLCLFSSKKLFDYITDEYGDMVKDWYIESDGDYYKFWNKVDEIVNPKPISHMMEDDYRGSSEMESIEFPNMPDPIVFTQPEPKIKPLKKRKGA